MFDTYSIEMSTAPRSVSQADVQISSGRLIPMYDISSYNCKNWEKQFS